jgi:hypothetical protein
MIQQNVYYANHDFCNSKIDYSRGGYPVHANDDSGKMATWKDLFILLVNQGDCTLRKKAGNPQKAGVAGLITDNTCLCRVGGLCAPCVKNEECETKEPIIAGHGSGANILIPSPWISGADVVTKSLCCICIWNNLIRMELVCSGGIVLMNSYTIAMVKSSLRRKTVY